MPSKKRRETTTTRQELPPEVERGIRFINTEAQRIRNLPLVPELSDLTRQGIEGLTQPIGIQSQEFLGSLLSPDAVRISPEARGFFSGRLNAGPLAPQSREFLGGLLASDPTQTTRPDIGGLTDLITREVGQAVGNRFTSAGRLPPGSQAPPGLIDTASGAVTRQLAPFVFQSEENALNRALQARQQQLQGAGLLGDLDARDASLASDAATRLAELDRLEAQLGLSQDQLGFSAAQALPLLEDINSRRLLEAGALEQAQAVAEAEAPFRRLQLLANPIVQSAQVAPRTTTETREFRTNPFLSAVGGILGGLNAAQGVFSSFGGGATGTVPSFTPFSVPSIGGLNLGAPSALPPSGLSLGTPVPSTGGLLFG